MAHSAMSILQLRHKLSTIVKEDVNLDQVVLDILALLETQDSGNVSQGESREQPRDDAARLPRTRVIVTCQQCRQPYSAPRPQEAVCPRCNIRYQRYPRPEASISEPELPPHIKEKRDASSIVGYAGQDIEVMLQSLKAKSEPTNGGTLV